MLIRTLFAAGFLLSMAAGAGDRADRDNLLGIWQAAEGASHEAWSLESKGDVLRVVRTDNGKVTLEATCKPDGTDCSATDEGKKVTVIMYFNGPALVQMETRDSYVTTRKFALDGESGRMTIEVNPITGPGKHYTLLLTRHLQAAAR
jgi:hypothetical protein